MLCELKVRNFAIVEDGILQLGKGMTAFTGETGAGKSLLLDAISLLLGAKAHSSLVRTGAKSAEVEGIFDLTSDSEKIELAAKLGFDIEDDEGKNFLLVRREISATDVSKNRIWIQGRSAMRSQLQELLGDWVEVSGQHEFLRLGREDYILGIIDQYGKLEGEAKNYTKLYTDFKDLEESVHLIKTKEANREIRLDYLKFQLEEFDKAGIREELVTEEEKLVALRAKLGNLEKIRVSFETAQNILDGSDSASSVNAGVLSQIQALLRELRSFSAFGDDFSNILKQAETTAADLTELSHMISGVLSSLEADPHTLEEAESKLSQLNRLKRKHNLDVQGLLKLKESARKEWEELMGSENLLQETEKALLKKQEELAKMAHKLHEHRAEAAADLSKYWQKDIRVLGMNQAKLFIQVGEISEFRLSGCTRVEALFSANPGEEARQLGKVASGGELSRIMLALKNLVAGRSEVGVYLFDEVDAGIGGETAQKVGERLRKLSKDNQVLVVTHLAQIAAKAHNQFGIKKVVEKNRTKTLVQELEKKDRELEIARMLGDMGSSAAKTLAKELLNRAEQQASA